MRPEEEGLWRRDGGVTVEAVDGDALLAADAEEAAAVVPAVDGGALGLGDGDEGLEGGEAVEGDPLGEGEEEVAGGAHLHGEGRAPPEARDGALQGVGVAADLGVGGIGDRGGGGGGVVGGGEGAGGVDAEGGVRAAEEELRGVGGDGVDPGGAAAEELHGVVRAVHHRGRGARDRATRCFAGCEGQREREEEDEGRMVN